MTGTDSAESEQPLPLPRTLFAAILAWCVPGAGHLYLGRRRRAAGFQNSTGSESDTKVAGYGRGSDWRG